MAGSERQRYIGLCWVMETGAIRYRGVGIPRDPDDEQSLHEGKLSPGTPHESHIRRASGLVVPNG